MDPLTKLHLEPAPEEYKYNGRRFEFTTVPTPPSESERVRPAPKSCNPRKI